MSPQPKFWSDSTYLKTTQYRTDENLSVRQQVHQKFSVNPQNWMEWVWGMGRVEPNQSVLDVGCGNGTLWAENFSAEHPAMLDATLLDLSRGMVAVAADVLASRATSWRAIEGDAMCLPFPQNRFDRVFANHMLYHVPDPAKATAEFWRVLRENGKLIVALNGTAHMRELWMLVSELLDFPALTHSSAAVFDPDTAASLFQVRFRRVTRHPFDDSLRVTDADLLWAYVISTTALRDARMTPENLTEIEEKFKARVTEAIQTSGYFYIKKEVVAFVCRK